MAHGPIALGPGAKLKDLGPASSPTTYALRLSGRSLSRPLLRRLSVISAPLRRNKVWPESTQLMILPDVVSHLADRTAPGGASLVFANRNGQPLAHSHFRGRVWLPALTTAGLTDVHFHDLRHAGNHLVAEAGANLRELMERMGHSSSRAALIYLHSTDDRQRALADAVAERAQAELKTGSCGTNVARPGETAAS